MDNCCCTDQNNVKIINIDFGDIAAGKVARKTVKFFNEGCKKQYYRVHHDPKTNSLDRGVFIFEFNEWMLIPGGSVDCRIEYEPTVPFHYNVDYFAIKDCDRICYRITVQGTCIGPNVVPSVSRLIMICPKEKEEIRKRFRLKNDSEIPAIFMFDIDRYARYPFELDLTWGTIPPNNHVYVTITFSPKRQGSLYALHLTCLIYCQSPVITEIYGYRGSPFSKNDEFVPLIFSDPKPSVIKNFEGYMIDAVEILQGTFPPISLSDNSLDFGKTEFNEKRNSRTVCVANHSNKDFIFKWDDDRESAFKIKPREATIRSQESGSFEVHFSPDKPDALFSRELLCRAFWEADNSGNSSLRCDSSTPVPIPLLASIRMIGHSFSDPSIGWIPQYEVPRTVIMPPSIPTLPVYATFLIKLIGHLPITFRFLPPPVTNFAVKPMVGMIQREYQIFALRMFSKVDEEIICTENWTIRFNGDSKNEIPIEFKAHLEHPKLNFNDKNYVEFSPVYPKCEQVARVTVRNISRHCIRYSFPELPSFLRIENSEGIIKANETLTQNWIFCPNEIGDYNYSVDCCLETLISGCSVGSEIHIPVKVTGKSQRGYLVALPEELDFGYVLLGQIKKLNFYIFNFSSVEIHYKLICEHRGWPLGNSINDIEISPLSDTILPGSKNKIDVSATPSEPGFYQLVIRYSMRSNYLDKNIFHSIPPRDICIINCICILPGFEVKDLLYFSFRENISKALLWDLMEIEKFNILTKSILPGEEETLNLRFPELILSEDPLLIKLLIINSSPIKSTWILSRVKICDCKKVVKTRGSTFKRREYSCDHRSACSISPSEGTLQPREKIIVTIKVCYLLKGKTNLRWKMELSNNRRLIINADIVAISDVEERPSLLNAEENTLIFDKTYIGDMNSAFQMSWMYNSTPHEAKYSLDTSLLHKMNTENLSDILFCKNPRGVVPGRSFYPIMFKFQPRRFESYQVTLPLKLGTKSTNLSIEAETDVLSKTRFFPGKIPSFDEFSVPELPVYFSVDRVVASPIPMHSGVNRMIMILNDSKNEIIGYQWKSYNLPKIIDISVTPSSGRIQPNKTQSFFIIIKSKSQPCKITATLCCQFLNLTAQRTYEKNIINYNALCELRSRDEAEMRKPEIVRKPKPFYKSISVGCYVYSLMDTDLKATCDEQLRSLPPDEIRVERNERLTLSDKKIVDTAAFILEGMIWDILDSKLFMKILKEGLVKAPNVKYGQYAIPLVQRRNLEDRSYQIPPRRFLEFIFEQMILGIVHEEFGLSVHHFNGPQDIRQLCYHRIDPRLRHQNKMSESILRGSVGLIEIEDPVENESKEFHPGSQVKFDVEDDDSSSESNN